jgi:hypothetical protein
MLIIQNAWGHDRQNHRLYHRIYICQYDQYMEYNMLGMVKQSIRDSKDSDD